MASATALWASWTSNCTWRHVQMDVFQTPCNCTWWHVQLHGFPAPALPGHRSGSQAPRRTLLLVDVRTRMRAARAAIGPAEQVRAALAVAQRVSALEEFGSARRIGAYVAVGGELDPAPTVAAARALGHEVLLPVVVAPGEALRFAPLEAGSELVPGRFGIPVPQALPQALSAGSDLDLVLVPLVAFDEDCGRAGMGAGFYDRTFASRLEFGPPPLLVGLAHDLQRVDRLEAAPHDVALDLVVTPTRTVRSSATRRRGARAEP
jgi:5-formyltetrahydrofolate cyclo-ligase